MRSKFAFAVAGVVLAHGAAFSQSDYSMTSNSSNPYLLRMQNTGATSKTLLSMEGIWDGDGMGIEISGVGNGINAAIQSSYAGVGANFNVTGEYYSTGVRTGSYTLQDYSTAIGGDFMAGGGNYTNNTGVEGESWGGDYSYNVGVYGTASGGTGSTNYAGYFNGEVGLVNIDWISDRQFKSDIKSLSGGLNKVMALKPRTYLHKTDEYKGRMVLPRGGRIGFIAQELEEVLPELVKEQTMPARYTEEEKKNKVKKESLTYKSVDYVGVVPVLVAAVQEQQALIDAMRAEIAALKAGK